MQSIVSIFFFFMSNHLCIWNQYTNILNPVDYTHVDIAQNYYSIVINLLKMMIDQKSQFAYKLSCHNKLITC